MRVFLQLGVAVGGELCKGEYEKLLSIIQATTIPYTDQRKTKKQKTKKKNKEKTKKKTKQKKHTNHLAVSVDIDALAVGLLQQLLEVMQVVAADQDALARRRRHGHLLRGGVPEGLGVALVQQGQHLQVGGADAEGEAQQIVKVLLTGSELAHRALHRGKHVLALLAQRAGVCCIGSQTLNIFLKNEWYNTRY